MFFSEQMINRMRGRFVRQLARMGLRLQRLDEEGRRYLLSSYNNTLPLPEEAEQTLRADDPALAELRSRYAALNVPATEHSQWNDEQLSENLALPWFRGDNVYVWQYRQLRSEARLKQYLALLDIESRDQLNLLNKLEEDGLFGCWTFQYSDRPPISRDLLDSVNEINFLEEHAGLTNRSELKVLDVGAGYGRLAHRLCTALDNVTAYDCVDAVPESTYLCRYYLDFRGVNPPARAVPLHELDSLHDCYDLAFNIHSFSECTRSTVQWWLQRIEERDIDWLLIVPNEPEELLTTERDGNKLDFMPDVEAAGYELRVKQPVYASDELRELIGVKDHFFLFKRKAAG